VAGDPDHLERDRDRNRDQQDSEDRAWPQIDNAHRCHSRSITSESDVVSLRNVTLRGTPIIEHAQLPHRGTVTIWVGVPDDPYINDKTALTTVDIQLHEGNSIVASLSTVLGPDQASEARALALEVKAAIEAGEIGLHASELEPFADKLR
jgi:hypothetical protein